MYGVAQHTVWLIFGVIMLILTAGLLYAILPHSDCDRMAEVSANELKAAIECAAKYADGTDPVTGQKCNVANVRLCQEDRFTIYGVGYVQAYLGLMIPEYMIYYQKFPTERYKSLIEGGTWGFTESYPFERAYVGQRPYDVRPTLTQFKQFFKTRYLDQGCTSDQGLCFNVRGREDVVMVEGDVPDVRLERAGYSFAETNPKFYVIAPCYAKVAFEKHGDGKIYGRPDKYSTPGASNYCFADETMLGGLMGTYTGETACEVGMTILNYVSLGSKKAVEQTAEAGVKIAMKQASKTAVKEFSEDVTKNVLTKFGKNLGKEAEEEAAKGALKAVIAKTAVKEMEDDVATNAVEISVRKGIQKMETTTAKRLTPLEEEIILKDVTKQVLEESADEPMETAMGKGVDRGFRQAKITVGEPVIESEAEVAASAGTTEAVEEFSTVFAQQARTGLKGLSASSKALITGKVLLNRYATMESLPTKKTDRLLYAFSAIPCVDVDICRAASACGETLMWPGLPFAELTDAKMTGTKTMDTASDVFHECCIQYNYGAEKDTDKINCTEPDYLVNLVKTDLKLAGSDSVNLTFLGSYLGLTKARIPNACELAIGENSKECRDALEMKERHLVENCLADVSENTYDFGEVKRSAQITAMARLYEDGCAGDIVIELSNDKINWVEANRSAAQPYPADNFIYVFGQNAFQYLRIREEGVCYFDGTSVVIDPLASRITDAEPNVRYDITAGLYNYFNAPADYMGKASKLCKATEYCTTMAKWLPEEGAWVKWADEGGGPTGTDFDIIGGDRVGIYTTEDSSVLFSVEAVS